MNLGRCCACALLRRPATTIIMLDRRGPVPGTGWGCVVCGLPPDGAAAALCDKCSFHFQFDESVVRFVCLGYPATGERAPIDELPDERFNHDEAKHAADELATHQRWGGKIQ